MGLIFRDILCILYAGVRRVPAPSNRGRSLGRRHTGSKTGTDFRNVYHAKIDSDFRLRVERVLFRGWFSEARDRQKEMWLVPVHCFFVWLVWQIVQNCCDYISIRSRCSFFLFRFATTEMHNATASSSSTFLSKVGADFRPVCLPPQLQLWSCRWLNLVDRFDSRYSTLKNVIGQWRHQSRERQVIAVGPTSVVYRRS